MYISGMKTMTSHHDLFKDYFIFLQNLENVDKLKLISHLSDSMIDENEILKSRKEKLNKAYGSLNTDMSAEEFIEDLRKSRYFDPEKKIDL